MNCKLDIYKQIREKLVYMPSGLISKDNKDVMAWSLKKDSNKFETLYLVNEDDEEYGVNLEKLNSKHDKLFKLILSDKQEAAMFMNMVLNLKYIIKADKLELYNKEFITSKFEKLESDVIYKLEDKKTYIIIEHQSTVDRSMPYRIFKYTTELLSNVIEKEKMRSAKYVQPRIISIVLYTGARPWNIRYIDDLQMPLEGFRKVKPLYKLVDINNYTKEELLNSNSMLSKAMLIEKERNEKDIADSLNSIEKKIYFNYDKRQIHLYKIILEYVLLNIKDVQIRKEIKEKLKSKRGDEKEMLNATMVLNRAIEKKKRKAIKDGLKQGIKQGVEQGMEQGMEQQKIYNIPIDVDTIEKGYPILCA